MSNTATLKNQNDHHKAFISNEMMVNLINLSGRQRMLSQRVALNVCLAAHSDAKDMSEAKEALALFVRTHTLLVHGDHEYPGIFFEELNESLFGKDHRDNQIKAFISLAEHAMQLSTTSNPDMMRTVNELGQAANDIVGVLNKITATYENESKRQATLRQKQQQDLIGSIQKIAQEAKIISFNAQVIAARAGPAGREFSVVAGVMTEITEKIDRLAIAALNRD